MTDIPTIDPAPPTIACTLAPASYAERIGWITGLNRAFLRSCRRNGPTLELVYAPAAVPQLRELIRRETDCCGFLRFELDEAPGSTRLRITLPAEVGESAEVLLSPFRAGAVDGASRPRARSVVTSAAVVLACGIWCALSFAFPAVALTWLGSVSAAFRWIYPWAGVLALVSMAAGWILVILRSRREHRPPAGPTLRAMVVATLVGGAALSWPILERLVVWLRP